MCKVLIEVIFTANYPATLYSRKIMLEHESNLKSPLLAPHASLNLWTRWKKLLLQDSDDWQKTFLRFPFLY